MKRLAETAEFKGSGKCVKEEKPRLNILGVSGHGKVVADIAKQNGYTEIYFYDDNTDIREYAGNRVLGTTNDLAAAAGHIFVAIGDPKARKRVMEKYCTRSYPVLVHPRATVAEDVVLGDGSVVMAGAVINPGARIGKGVIVNTGSSIDHDCVILDFCHIAVGSHVCGTVKIGEGTWVGVGSSISNNVDICGNCMIGAGAVVINDITESGTYVGVPVKKI